MILNTMPLDISAYTPSPKQTKNPRTAAISDLSRRPYTEKAMPQRGLQNYPIPKEPKKEKTAARDVLGVAVHLISGLILDFKQTQAFLGLRRLRE